MTVNTLSIAGFDGSGGAGIQADLKTFSALGAYGLTVLTALPVQNTQGVRKVWPLEPQCVLEQLDSLFEDIPVHAIKIGMLFDVEIIEKTASFLKVHAHNIPLVLDPVMVAKNGGLLLKPDAVCALKHHLMPLATVCTPNIPEAEVLAEMTISNAEDVERAGTSLMRLGPRSLFLKGGHLQQAVAQDLFMDFAHQKWVSSERVNTLNTHGTGCTLSAAIAVFLAKGYSSFESCLAAKEYLTKAIHGAKDVQLGKGHGPVHHFHNWW